MTGLTRRALLLGVASFAAARYAAATVSRSQPAFAEAIAGIRREIGGRIGVHVLDTASGTRLGVADDERFAMCSTFKVPLVAAILIEIEQGKFDFGRSIPISEKDLVPYAPVVTENLARGSMTVEELCAASIVVSDNAAGNLLLGLIGGPAGLTSFLRKTGDAVTRLDRLEVELNTNLEGDPRDTTTPRAMVDTMARILTGKVLSNESCSRLVTWLEQSPRGKRRIRAGVPADWRIGDKTGLGNRGACNDVAIVWPPGRDPWLIAVYLSESSLPVEKLEAAHARIASAIVASLR